MRRAGALTWEEDDNGSAKATTGANSLEHFEFCAMTI